ncbi:MAG TPA: S-formylglutathione hydrolase [Nitrospiraceae bacterium]|nr:S-formylglutathione hydrolase [Nitrospiraceae bacterium]
MKGIKLIEEYRCFGGSVRFYSHYSACCKGDMRFSVFLPPMADKRDIAVLYYLAGLTCTEETFMIKSGAQQYAAEHGILLVSTDTSPKEGNVPGQDSSWDLGLGAGFYVDAIKSPWAPFYSMFSYVTKELPELICNNFNVRPDRQGIFGHSMGGHGAIVCALRNPDLYRSVSAFAPICSPMNCPWGQKAFSSYLGTDRRLWRAYDACELLKESRIKTSILIDQGTDDKFLKGQLKPEMLKVACESARQSLDLRFQEGYDHSYYFISSFIKSHIRHHAVILNG